MEKGDILYLDWINRVAKYPFHSVNGHGLGANRLKPLVFQGVIRDKETKSPFYGLFIIPLSPYLSVGSLKILGG